MARSYTKTKYQKKKWASITQSWGMPIIFSFQAQVSPLLNGMGVLPAWGCRLISLLEKNPNPVQGNNIQPTGYRVVFDMTGAKYYKKK